MNIFRRLHNRYIKYRLKYLADNIYKITIKDLIEFHDLVALQCTNRENRAQSRLLDVSIKTAITLKLLVDKDYNFKVTS